MDDEKYYKLIDGHMRAAQERGDFDDLPGTGKPLPGDGQPYDEQWWLKGLIEREGLDMTAALPPSLAVRKEMQRLPETLAALSFEAAVREHLTGLNKRIRDARLTTIGGPPVVLRDVDVEDAVREWRAARKAREAREAAQSTSTSTGSPRSAPGSSAVRNGGTRTGAETADRGWWRRRTSRP